MSYIYEKIWYKRKKINDTPNTLNACLKMSGTIT
jgi:hypothetical protein